LIKQRDSVQALLNAPRLASGYRRASGEIAQQSCEQSLLGNNYSAIAIDRAISSVSESSYIIPRRRAGCFSAIAVKKTWHEMKGGAGRGEERFTSGLVIEMR